MARSTRRFGSRRFPPTAIGSTGSLLQSQFGGNPGSYGIISLSIPNAGNYHSVSIYTGQSYTPSTQGPILSIDLSGDFKAVTYGADYFFALTQGGHSYFLWQFYAATSANWAHATATATSASDFYDIFSYAHPDFVNGGPIEFGLIHRYTTTGSGFVSRSFGVDNYGATVTAVPEPSAWIIMAVLSGLSALSGRKLKTKAEGRRTFNVKR